LPVGIQGRSVVVTGDDRDRAVKAIDERTTILMGGEALDEGTTILMSEGSQRGNSDRDER
jgi:hypothetical protein